MDVIPALPVLVKDAAWSVPDVQTAVSLVPKRLPKNLTAMDIKICLKSGKMQVYKA